MMGKIEWSKLTDIGLMSGEDDEETEQFQALYGRAQDFLKSFTWSGEIRAAHFGLGIADIIGVFLFDIVPVSKSVDRFLWVIVGDVPPAYLVIDNACNPARALASYLSEMNKWIDAVNNGDSIENRIPVNGSPTKENAAGLKKRLEFIVKEILPHYKKDLA